MDQERLLRQVALVSYGSSYLRGELGLDDFFRHGIFHGHRLLFRERATHALLADDFTLWLTIVHALGAQRLSLHLAEDGGPDALRIAVHFDGHYQLWACAEETPRWRQHPALPPEQYDSWPDAAYYGGAQDCYTCLGETAGQLAVGATNWPDYATAIARALQLRVAPGPAAPYVGHGGDACDWSRLPLFPYLPALAQAHQLLALLDAAQQGFASDSHCKNDGSDFHQLDAQAQAAKYAWAEQLALRLQDLQLRCANALPQAPDWQALKAAIERDLALRLKGAGPEQWLAALETERARIDNECNFKNEHSQYQHLSEADAAQVDAWAERLADWIAQVALHCPRAAAPDPPAGMPAPALAASAPAGAPARAGVSWLLVLIGAAILLACWL